MTGYTEPPRAAKPKAARALALAAVVAAGIAAARYQERLAALLSSSPAPAPPAIEAPASIPAAVEPPALPAVETRAPAATPEAVSSGQAPELETADLAPVDGQPKLIPGHPGFAPQRDGKRLETLDVEAWRRDVSKPIMTARAPQTVPAPAPAAPRQVQQAAPAPAAVESVSVRPKARSQMGVTRQGAGIAFTGGTTTKMTPVGPLTADNATGMSFIQAGSGAQGQAITGTGSGVGGLGKAPAGTAVGAMGATGGAAADWQFGPFVPSAQGRAVVIYMAEGCGFCRIIHSQILQIRAELERNGIPVVIVVGWDEPAALAKYAASFGGKTAVDTRAPSSAPPGLALSGVPAMAVFQDGRMVKVVGGATDIPAKGLQAALNR